jgi:hypothetical protein
MPNITNSFILNITAQDDASQLVPINKGTTVSYDCSAAEGVFYISLAAGANVISLPKSPATFVYLKNNDAAKTIQVNWTQNGGAGVNVVVLNPGDIIALAANPAGATTPGITALSLTPSAANALLEMFLGG